MRIGNMVRVALFASLTIASAVPAFADDGWHGPDHRGWQEREWREHEWREHEWREHHAWAHRYPPPAYGYYAPPNGDYGGPGYYR